MEVAVLCSLWERCSPGAQFKWHRAPDPRAPMMDKAGNLSFPSGIGGSGEGTGQWELSYCWAPPKLCRSVHWHLPPGASRPMWTRRLQLVAHGELTPELEIWLPPLLFFLFVSPCAWEGQGCQREKGLTGQTAHTEPSTWQGAGHLCPGTDTWESVQQAPPLKELLEVQVKRKFTEQAALESSRTEGKYCTELEGPYFSFSITTRFYISLKISNIFSLFPP